MAHALYYQFLQKVYRQKDVLVSCPHCAALQMTLATYLQDHIPNVHGVKDKLTCRFCLDFHWRPKEIRNERVNEHRLRCMKTRFSQLFPQPRQVPVPLPTPTRSTVEPCQKCRLPLSRGTPNTNYGTFCEEVGTLPPFLKAPFPNTHVSFTSKSGLGDFMCPIIRAFEKFTEDGEDVKYMWFHISVRAAVWEPFVENVLSIKGIYVLPYWCLCDGTTNYRLSDIERHHRHMVIVKKKGVAIIKVWRDTMKCDNTAAKFKKLIKKREHLINTLFYVSQPKAKCDGTAENGIYDYDGDIDSHYFLNMPLYHHAKIAMYILFVDGLHTYIQLRGDGRMPTYWHKLVQGKGSDRWIPVYLFDIDILGCILPIAKDLEFWYTTQVAPDEDPHIFLLDTVMVLTKNPCLEDMSDREWNEHQRNTGNIFLDAIHESKYVLGQKQRTWINSLNKVVAMEKESWAEEKRMLSDSLSCERMFSESITSGLQNCLKERDDLKTQLQVIEGARQAVEIVRNQMSDEIKELQSLLRSAEKARIQQYEDRIQQNIQQYEDRMQQNIQQYEDRMQQNIQQYEDRMQQSTQHYEARIQQYEAHIQQKSDENKELKIQLRESEEARNIQMTNENETLQQVARGAVAYISKTD